MDDKPLEPQPTDRRPPTAAPEPDSVAPEPVKPPTPETPQTPVAPPEASRLPATAVDPAAPPVPPLVPPTAPALEPPAPEPPASLVEAPVVAVPSPIPSQAEGDQKPPLPVVEGRVEGAPPHGHEYPRFRLMARIEHMTLLVTFTILCLTGLPQKFPFSPVSQGLITLLGGIEVVRLIHRWAAIVLILGTVYHLLTSAYRLFVKHEDMRMLPDLKDATDLRDTVAYNLGFIDEAPKMRKFNFGEKFEYWAVVWGTAVMIMTGFILWNPLAATQFIPGNFIPVALEAHGWEAVLAAVSIVIWHLYNVLVKHRNVSMFTGTLPHKIMEEEHALELERLDAGGDPWRVVPPAVLARRRRVYFVVAGIVAVMALALVVWMFTFEDTAIIAVPEATRNIFVPLATPIP